jgi:hypothetical protein
MIDTLKNFKVIHWVLIQSILITLFWIFNPYLAKLLTAILAPIFLAILIISLIADRIEKSKISNVYYFTLVGLILDLLVIFIFFQILESSNR